MLDGAAGLALDCVLENFEITAMEMFKLDKPTAAEFYEVWHLMRGRCPLPGSAFIQRLPESHALRQRLPGPRYNTNQIDIW